MRHFLIGFIIFISVDCAVGQDQNRVNSKWHLNPGAGLNLPISKLFLGEITDNLIEFSDHTYYLKFISASYFFNDRWGLEFAFQTNVSKSILDRADRFNAQIEDEYGEAYFVTYGYATSYYDETDITSGYSRGSFGLVYRIEKPKYIILPKIFFGTTAFDADRGFASLKERGAHTVLELSYNSKNGSGDNLMIAPAISVGYRISNRFLVSFDVVYSYFKVDFQYTKELRNTFTGEVWTESIIYNRNIHTLSIGAGLIIELGWVNKFQ